MKRVAVVLALGCSAKAPPPAAVQKPAPKPDDSHLLAALPKPAPVDTAKFAGVTVCVRCHVANDEDFRDKRGRDVSPITEAQAGMMSLSARDPYFLAALRREIDANRGAKAVIEAVCLRCHAPVGFAENPALTLDDVVRGTSPAAVLAREGVGCAGCHSLDPGAQVVLRTDRVSYGGLAAPLVDAMMQMSNTRPVHAAHMEESVLCASCHSVFVHRLDAQGQPVGDEVPEQATFLEWKNSDFATTTTCQDCHMPQGDDELDRTAPSIATAFSTRPPDAPIRPFYRRHTLRGGNVYMLDQLAKHASWLGAAATASQLEEAARATSAFLTRSARLSVVGVGQELRVTVHNETGHKLPTGYPTRRMWLHVRAIGFDGHVVFESGAPKRGTIVNGDTRLDGPGVIAAHVDQGSADDVAIWEAVPVDEAGARTHLLLGTARIAKDNRILPAGWSATHPEIARMRPIGVDGDGDFLPGRDSVRYVLPPTAEKVVVRLLYQAVPPETIESYKATDSREAARFLAIASDPPEPSVLATESVTLQASP